jgi:hypothetical protein
MNPIEFFSNSYRNLRTNVSEMVVSSADFTRTMFPPSVTSGMRSWFTSPNKISFWPKPRPVGEGSQVNYNFTRQLYRNTGENGFGGGFAKPIVNLQVGFIGIPTASTGDEGLDQFLNDCIEIYWTDEIQQMLLAALRDSKTIVRLRPLDILDPLMTMEEKEHSAIEVIAPENIDIEYNARNKNVIEKCVIRHKMSFVIDDGSVTDGRDPTVEEHVVLEIIDRQTYKFFDHTTRNWLDSLGGSNNWNFVPVMEVFNDWDASLKSGQSEFENVIPFINAFHDVFAQGMQAHKYHSTPKLKLKLSDVGPFIRNNFPAAWDAERGDIIPGAEVSLNGREIMFFQSEDDAEFLEARSVLGDTKQLLEFILDCICIASETPEWAFMRVDSGSANSDRNAQTVPFVKKIDRKRLMMNKYIQQLFKMVIVASGQNDGIPIRAGINWKVIRPDDQFITNQAFQQLAMGLEVARDRNEITDATYQQAIRNFLPHMKSSAEESAQAKREQPAPETIPVVAGPQGRNE